MPRAGPTAVRPALINQLVLWYCDSNGIDPGGKDYKLLYNTLDSLLAELDSAIELGPLDKETTGITVTIHYSGPVLRQLLEDIMDEILSGSR